jgi:hypothetical protein
MEMRQPIEIGPRINGSANVDEGNFDGVNPLINECEHAAGMSKSRVERLVGRNVSGGRRPLLQREASEMLQHTTHRIYQRIRID